MKRILSILFVLLVTLALFGCELTGTKDKVQGVTDTEVLVGNTATTSGQYASIGTPFNQAINAVFDYVNKEGGVAGRSIRFIHYDDQGPGGDGIALTEKLVEEDKVFALVGHFGTWNVAPTVEYIQEQGIPMVHAATGVNDLYFENTPGNPVMAIQPIYKTDGRVMAARAVASEIYGALDTPLPAGSKITVFLTADDVGRSIKAGVEAQFEMLATGASQLEFDVQYLEVAEGTYATQVAKAANADALILAMNQAPFAATVSALHNAENSAPIFTSYVNADVTHIDQEESNVGDIYVNGWYSGSETDQTQYEEILNSSTKLSAAEKADLAKNTHAISGYIAAMSFVEGLKRVGEKELTWKSYIAAMESGKLNLPLAGAVDYRGGQRIGTDTMSMSKYDRDEHKLVVVDTLKTIADILGEEDPGRGKVAQGVDVNRGKILVGNTAATSGAFAGVGVPFNAGLRAAFEAYNNKEGSKWELELKHYDDGFDAATGIALTERLVEEDKIFALVGHFGTPTVGATIEYIQDVGIPMVYAATGINDLYFEATPGNPVMAVQPIYKTDGRVMAARALNTAIFGANKDELLGANDKVALVYTNDDAGRSIKDGVVQEIPGAQQIQLDPAAPAQAVAALDAETKVIILATNQAPMKAYVNALQNAGKQLPVFTSYVNADPTAVDGEIVYGFDIYTNAWVDVLSEEGQTAVGEFVAAIAGASFLSEEEKVAMYANSFATAGYIAGAVFIQGIERVGNKIMSWENFIDAMEDGEIDIPMGGSVNFANGNRIGIDTMSLLKYNAVTKEFELVAPMASLPQIKGE